VCRLEGGLTDDASSYAMTRERVAEILAASALCRRIVADRLEVVDDSATSPSQAAGGFVDDHMNSI
jgi:hypothetical protein